MKSPTTGIRRRPLALRVWRNPLARRIDRTEATVTWTLVAVFLLSLPILATIASVQWGNLSAEAAAEESAATAVDAVLTSDATYPVSAYRSSPGDVTAQATWTGRNGLVGGGEIDVMPGARTGDHVVVWLDQAGDRVAAPMTTTDAAIEAALIGVSGWVGLGLLLAGVWWVVRRRLDRHRWRAWAQEWECAGPQPQ